jgi:pimeloyl-ACP methyl ester carboxylesterase
MPFPVSERLRRTLSGGVVISRQFLSNYQRYVEAEADADEYVENERIPVEHWMHEPRRPRATILALHGFTMGYPGIDAFALMASEWFKRGLDVALMALPYHGARAPKSARFSGEAFASPNVGQLNEGVRQAVSDVHMLMNWLRESTRAPVGLLGLSLGGYVSALVAGLTAAPAFVIPLVPPVDMADMGWRFYERSRHRERGQEPPLAREQQEAVYRLHSPLTFPLQIPKERTLIVAGRGDRVVPAEHPQALWLHWGKPGILWFSGSHVAPFGRGKIVARIVEHLESIQIL